MSHILAFISQLQNNNNKSWFDAHKKDFESAKLELVGIVSEVIAQVSKFDTSVADIQAKDCLFRIYRDVRFSNDKTPYKTHFGAYICSRGKKSSGPGYYMHIQPQHSFIGGGVYMPEPEILAKIRQEIDYNGDKFREIVEKPSFKKYFPKLWDEDKLSRPPKGYEADNPVIEFLKLKSFAVSHSIADDSIGKSKFIDETVAAFKEQYPFHKFLDEALS